MLFLSQMEVKKGGGEILAYFDDFTVQNCMIWQIIWHLDWQEGEKNCNVTPK